MSENQIQTDLLDWYSPDEEVLCIFEYLVPENGSKLISYSQYALVGDKVFEFSNSMEYLIYERHLR